MSMGFPGDSVVKKKKERKKNLLVNSGDMGSIPGLGKSPGKGNGNPFQHTCLENPMDRGAWWATIHGVTMSWTQLSTQAYF